MFCSNLLSFICYQLGLKYLLLTLCLFYGPVGSPNESNANSDLKQNKIVSV